MMKKKSKKFGFVYFISNGEFTKIGTARNVQDRMKSLQTGSPTQLYLMASFFTDSPRQLEKEIHRMLNCYLVGGEWFDIQKDDLVFIFSTICKLIND